MKEKKSTKIYVKITSIEGMALNIAEYLNEGKLELIREMESEGLLYGVLKNEKGIKVKVLAANYEKSTNKKIK